MKKKGFTLVELLAVIVILGVIFMFIVPRLSTLIKNGETKEKEVLEAKIVNASKEYVSSYNRSLYDNLVEVGDYNYVCLNNLLDNKLVDESDLNGLDEISGIKIELQEKDKVDYIIEYGDSSVCDNASINLTVELNGGTLSTNVEGSYSKESTVELGVPIKEGTTFNKWIITKGSGEIEGNTLKMHYTDVTVYALYKSLATLTVDKNGGSSNQEFEEKYPTGTIIELIDLEKRGYTFTGWELVRGDSILSGKRLTIGLEGTEIKGTFGLNSYTCSAGKYLKAGEIGCTSCLANNYCSGGTYSYNESNDQGIDSCPGSMTSNEGSSLITQCKVTCAAGTYLKKGETSCTQCAAGKYCANSTTCGYSDSADCGITGTCAQGSYSVEGSSVCTACEGGKTNSAGASSCTAACSMSGVTAWNTTTWNSNNTVSNLCSAKKCGTGYVLSGGKCVAKKVTVVFHRNTSSSDTASASQTFTYGVSGNKFGYYNNGTVRWGQTATKQFGDWGRKGYALLGWAKSKSATARDYSVNSGVADSWINENCSSATCTVNLYAVWRESRVRIYISNNGGTIKATTKLDHDFYSHPNGELNQWKIVNESLSLGGLKGTTKTFDIVYKRTKKPTDSTYSNWVRAGISIAYTKSDNITDYTNDGGYLYIYKSGTSGKSGQEYKCMSGNCGRSTYNQSVNYTANEYCNIDYYDCNIVVGPNWN